MTEVKERIEMVLREVFGGDIDKMAASLDLDRGTMFRYRSGSIRPSKRSLNLPT